ncbi:MAG: GNAT family N-acetyltransferase [Cyclobacteriaceae bacterium]|nr:GNAT family N-acetyltransferase [Cyclobacteriaceae bacterium]
MEFQILVATSEHHTYAQEICDLMELSAKARGTGIAKRSPEYVKMKMDEGKAIIALTDKGAFAGFCYIESWGEKFAANSGLIIAEEFRKMGLAMRVKRKAFELSRKKFPNAKLFGLTTSLAVMKINSELGYRPVTFSELTDDEQFWKGCQSCVNYDILNRTNRKHCLCTGMLYDPVEKYKHKRKTFKQYNGKYAKWLKAKADFLLEKFKR